MGESAHPPAKAAEFTNTDAMAINTIRTLAMAIAQKWKAAYYGRPGFEDLFDHRVYCVCGDGCMMEGVGSEASSLAGHLQLDNLCLIYDDNRISIDGSTSLAFTEDVGARFLAYKWNVVRVPDGNDLGQFCKAIETARATTGRPTLIVVSTHIGYGAPHKQDTKEAHGEPLGADEVKLPKKGYGWPEDAQFLVPHGVYDRFKEGIGRRGAEAHAAWKRKVAEYEAK